MPPTRSPPPSSTGITTDARHEPRDSSSTPPTPKATSTSLAARCSLALARARAGRALRWLHARTSSPPSPPPPPDSGSRLILSCRAPRPSPSRAPLTGEATASGSNDSNSGAAATDGSTTGRSGHALAPTTPRSPPARRHAFFPGPPNAFRPDAGNIRPTPLPWKGVSADNHGDSPSCRLGCRPGSPSPAPAAFLDL